MENSVLITISYTVVYNNEVIVQWIIYGYVKVNDYVYYTVVTRVLLHSFPNQLTWLLDSRMPRNRGILLIY